MRRPWDHGGRKRRTAVILGTAFGVLAIAGWFAFTAKSVQLVTVPLADEVGLPGTLFKFRIGDRFLVRSGSHRVVARRAGYHGLDVVIKVGQLPAQTVELELAKLPGSSLSPLIRRWRRMSTWTVFPSVPPR